MSGDAPVSPYSDVRDHLRDASLSLMNAGEALDLIGPGDDAPPGVVALILGIRTQAKLIGRRLGQP